MIADSGLAEGAGEDSDERVSKFDRKAGPAIRGNEKTPMKTEKAAPKALSPNLENGGK